MSRCATVLQRGTCDCKLDTYIEHRLLLEARQHPDEATRDARPANQRFPPQLMRRFEVGFVDPKARFKAVAVRDVKANQIGKLVSVKGIVTRCFFHFYFFFISAERSKAKSTKRSFA